MFDLIKLLSPFFLTQWKRLAFFALLTPFVFALDFSLLAGGSRLLNGETQTQFIFLLVAAFLLVEGLRHLQKYLLSITTVSVAIGLQNQLIQKILHAPFTSFSSMTSGGKSKRILRDAEQVASFTESFLSLFFREPLRVIFFSAILLFWSPFLFLILATSLVFVSLISWWIGKKFAAIYEKTNQQESTLFQRLQKILSSWHWIKVTGMEEAESRKWEEATGDYFHLQAHAAFLNLVYPVIFRLLLVLVGLLLWWLYAAGKLTLFATPGDWAKGVGVILLWVQSIKSIATSCVGLIDEGIRARQLSQILNWPQETVEKSVSHEKTPLSQLLLGEIHFGYEARREFFNGLSLQLNAGDTLVVSGPNGSGKTTLSYLLLRFLEPRLGEIQYNGRKSSEVPLSWLRQRTGIIFQQPQLLEATLSENLYYGLNGTQRGEMEEVLEKVGLAHLAPWEKEGKLLGETLRELSFGEKQKLALARVFLQHPDLLILDEATSGLDLESEEKILKELFLKRKEKITILITHKWRFPEMPSVRHLKLGNVYGG